MSTRFACLVIVLTSVRLHAGDSAPPCDPDAVPQGLAQSDWQSIRAAYEAGRHAFQPVEGGWQARNPGQQWTTTFDGRGFLVEPRDGGWQWGLELKSYGFPGAERAVAAPGWSAQSPVRSCDPHTGLCGPLVKADGQLLTCDWDANVQEWFINDTRGLEHGFTVRERPGMITARSGDIPVAVNNHPRSGTPNEGAVPPQEASPRKENAPFQGGQITATGMSPLLERAGDTAASPMAAAEHFQTEPLPDLAVLDLGTPDPGILDSPSPATPLQIELTVRGTLRPRVSADAQSVAFQDASGATVLNYSGLKVWDADGKVLASRFELPDSQRSTLNSQPCLRLLIEEHDARYPLTIDPIAQQAYLKAHEVNAFDEFGSSVAVSDDTVVVGAILEDSSTTGVNSTPNDTNGVNFNAGAAYVFVRSGTTWTQQAYLKAHQVSTDDQFGKSVAVSGNTVVVGAWQEDSSTTGVNSTPDEGWAEAGAAYVFVRSGTTWTQQAYLKAHQVYFQDQFGMSVAVSGDTVVVGAIGEDSSTTGVNSTPNENSGAAGAAYVFVRTGTTWAQQAYLKAHQVSAGDEFGYSVAVSGDTVVVGVPWEDSSTVGVNSTPNESASNAGAACVFVRSGTTWTQQAYLKAHQVNSRDFFGYSVGVSGDTVVVGARGEGSNTTGVNSTPNLSATAAGAADVFVRSGTNWIQQAYLKAHQVTADDQFGWSVAVSGDTVVVGARREDSSTTGVNRTPNESATQAGAAYVFTGFGPSPDADGDGLLDSWELTHWPTIIGHSAQDDFDGDGYVELLELALGLNPKSPDPGGLPPVTSEGGYLTMTLTKHPGVTYEVQSAGTLLEGQPDSFSPASTTVLLNDTTTLKVRDNFLIGTAPGRFLRVKVTAAP